MGNPLLHPRRDLSTLSMFGRAFGSRRKFALRPLHIFFIGAQELGTGRCVPPSRGYRNGAIPHQGRLHACLLTAVAHSLDDRPTQRLDLFVQEVNVCQLRRQQQAVMVTYDTRQLGA